MTKEIHDGFIDPSLLSNTAYKDGSRLDKRKLLYLHTRPYFNIEDEVIKLGCLETSQSLLEIGCGTGKFLLKAAKFFPDARLVGLDISSGIFSDSQEEANNQELNISFQVGNAQRVQHPDNSFDRVIGIHVLHHVTDIHQALTEMARVTKPDGLVLITANSVNSRQKFRFLKEKAAKAMNREVYNDASVRFCLEDGLKMASEHFNHTATFLFESKLSLARSEPYVEYFDSIREFWQPSPTDHEWSLALTLVKDYVEEEIAINGKFEDKTGFGVIVASASSIAIPRKEFETGNTLPQRC